MDSGSWSIWPFSISVFPPPEPFSVAITWYRPGSTSCRSTSYPQRRKFDARNKAICDSSVLKLGMSISFLAKETSQSSFTRLVTLSKVCDNHNQSPG